jgi:hypothetical protein
MKRIARYILNGLTVLSLLLCIAAAGLWARGHLVADRAYYSRWRLHGTTASEGAYWVQSGAGIFILATRQQNLTGMVADPTGQFGRLAAAGPRWQRVQLAPDDAMTLASGPRPGLLGRLGFWSLRAAQTSLGPGNYYAEWAAPAWAVCLMLSLLPAAWVLRWRRARLRRRAGLCPTCGYDLRATPDRCPECGTVPSVPSVPSAPSGVGVRSSVD